MDRQVIRIVWHRRLQFGILWTVAGCGRAMPDTEARRFSKPGPERALPIYTIDEPGCGLDDRMVAAVTIPPVMPDQLETPNKVVPSLPPKSVPTELESRRDGRRREWAAVMS